MSKDKTLKKIKNTASGNLVKFAVLNLTLIFSEVIYLLLRIDYLNDQIPLWYTMPWGIDQLAGRDKIFLIPAISLMLLIVGLAFMIWIKDIFLRYGETFMMVFISLCNVTLAISMFKVIGIASTPFRPLVNPGFLQIVPAIIASFLVVYISTPWFIKTLNEKGIVTDPQIHDHPGMLLKKPSVRGGGLVFVFGVLISGIFFVRLSPIFWGILVSAILAAMLGLADDIQNTNKIAKLKFVENPLNRFILQGIVVLPTVLAGVQVLKISNPLNGIIDLGFWQITLGGNIFYPVAIVFTIFWMLWIMNVLSWSNGVDGQYSGIIGIAAIVIALITMRDPAISSEYKPMIMLAAVTAGASLGLLPYTWHPSKIMWGFGAISAGVIISTLSILTKAKVATALIVLAIPFLDGLITAIRRILQKKSPMKGDRGHLHHLLLDRGWSIQKVAVFYWISTLATGYIGIISADKDPMLAALTMAGGAAFIIMLINVRTFVRKRN